MMPQPGEFRDPRMMRTSTLLLGLMLGGLLTSVPLGAQNLRITGLSITAGNWISVTDGDWDTREDYGTLPAMGLFFSGWGWNGSLGLPVKTSFKRIRHNTRFALGDAEFTLGRTAGIWTPRLVLRMPLYSWSVENASENELFIGGGSVRAGLGVGVKAPKDWLSPPWNAGFDMEATTAVTEALAEIGSSHVVGALQITRSLGPRWKLGGTSLFLLDYWRWIPDYWDQDGEIKFTVVPRA